jgi:acyl-CoA synthetase (AMP-forming)/AMP-acid ligase II
MPLSTQTGDEASMDAEGYVRITGRIKDLIIRGGENIHPLEVENCLFAHPAVSEVSVVGLPDERYGEVVAAFVIPHKGAHITADDVRSWVKEKLSHHLGNIIPGNTPIPCHQRHCSHELTHKADHNPQYQNMSFGQTTTRRPPAAKSRSSSSRRLA